MRRQTPRSKSAILHRMQLYLAELPDPDQGWNDGIIMQRSYAKSAVSELIKEVKESDTDPALVISEFIKRVDKRSGLLFAVSYDIAVDLYDILFL